MTHKLSLSALAAAFVPALLLLATGCNSGKDEAPRGVPQSQQTAAKDKNDKEEHGHKPGAHGGTIVSLGRDSYHVEAVFEKGGLLKLFTLGKDEARIIDVENQTLKAYVKEEGASEAAEMDLNPVPRAGDKPGRTSQFVGKLPSDLVGKALVVTIPIIAVEGERFRVGFASTLPRHEEGMPIGVTSAAEEKELYLKPGGIYTEADIQANGNITASQKFKGIPSKHDMKPKPGDKICPVTMTKANPKFMWIVAGKTYEFCCPPCVDEFLTWAKTEPDLVKDPDSYVKKK